MPRPAAIFLLAPVVAIAIVFGLYLYLFASGYIGRPASGETVEMRFEGCDAAREVILDRAEEMGLGTPRMVDEGRERFTLTAVLPDEPEAVSAIPVTLSTAGVLALRADGEVLVSSADVVSSGVRLDLTMTPTTLVVLTLEGARAVAAHMNAHPDGRMAFVLDGEVIHDQSNRKPFSEAELDIPPSAANDRARMALAAHRGIIIGSPHRCDVALIGTKILVPAP